MNVNLSCTILVLALLLSHRSHTPNLPALLPSYLSQALEFIIRNA